MRRSTFCEEEPIVPLHEKLKLQTVYAVYEFEYNSKTVSYKHNEVKEAKRHET